MPHPKQSRVYPVPTILARPTRHFTAHQMPRYNPNTPMGREAMKRDRIPRVNSKGQPCFDSQKEVDEVKACSYGEAKDKYWTEE